MRDGGVKAAIKRRQSDACMGFAEREQARRSQRIEKCEFVNCELRGVFAAAEKSAPIYNIIIYIINNIINNNTNTPA